MVCSVNEIPVLKVPYEEGSIEGDVEIFDPRKKGQLASRASYEGNVLHGELVTYDKKGEKRARVEYVNGTGNGADETWDGEGNPLFKGTLVNGRYEGEAFHWVNGQKKTVFFKGGVQQADPAATKAQDACVDSWVAAHRKEVGPDAGIRSDMLEEWEEMCKEGRRPPVA